MARASPPPRPSLKLAPARPARAGSFSDVVGETIAERYAPGGGRGPRRHVERLQGARHAARAPRRDQDPPRAVLDDDEFVERFKREARSVAQLQHPNIVTVIDRGQEGDSPVHRLRVHRRGEPQGARRPEGPSRRQARARARDRNRPCARVRARARARAPRREAAKRPAERRRRRQGHRLRDRPRARRRERDDADRHRARDARATSRRSRRAAGPSTRSPTSTRSGSSCTSSSPARCRSPGRASLRSR